MLIPQVKNGVLNIDKPQGITSHDVVDVIRKIFPTVKVGHTGTLDPLATGVLPICIGKATKLSNILTSEIKRYKVKMLLGVETDTYDVTGKIVFASVVKKDEIYIKERIKRFIGKQLQKPPMYSAIRIDGRHAYNYAREGKKLDLPPREIEIFNIENIEVEIEKREVNVPSGTGILEGGSFKQQVNHYIVYTYSVNYQDKEAYYRIWLSMTDNRAVGKGIFGSNDRPLFGGRQEFNSFQLWVYVSNSSSKLQLVCNPIWGNDTITNGKELGVFIFKKLIDAIKQ